MGDSVEHRRKISIHKIRSRLAHLPLSVADKTPVASAQLRPGRNPYERGLNRASHSGSRAGQTRS
jgi:hypothetical protein